jgi:hypothetical protein
MIIIFVLERKEDYSLVEGIRGTRVSVARLLQLCYHYFYQHVYLISHGFRTVCSNSPNTCICFFTPRHVFLLPVKQVHILQ